MPQRGKVGGNAPLWAVDGPQADQLEAKRKAATGARLRGSRAPGGVGAAPGQRPGVGGGLGPLRPQSGRGTAAGKRQSHNWDAAPAEPRPRGVGAAWAYRAQVGGGQRPPPAKPRVDTAAGRRNSSDSLIGTVQAAEVSGPPGPELGQPSAGDGRPPPKPQSNATTGGGSSRAAARRGGRRPGPKALGGRGLGPSAEGAEQPLAKAEGAPTRHTVAGWGRAEDGPPPRAYRPAAERPDDRSGDRASGGPRNLFVPGQILRRGRSKI